MEKSLVRENSFDGAPGGGAGVSNYQTGYGTPGGGNTTQNPSNFASSDKTVNHMNNQEGTGSSAVPKMPERSKASSTNHMGGSMGSDQKDSSPGTYQNIVARPPEKSSTGAEISPAAQADARSSKKPLNPDQSYEPQINQLFKKNITPSPDEIMSGLQYELSNMVKKDKVIAKQIVLQNLKKDPTYYSRLGMLNINDKDMKVDEGKQSTFTKTKNLLDQMVMEKKQRIVAPPPNVNEILNALWGKRHGFKQK